MTRWQRQGGVQPGGDVGGDYQATEAFTVRYTRPDRPGAVVDVTVYGEDLSVYGEHAQTGTGFQLTTMTETILCEDVRHPFDTETWSNATYQSGRERFSTARDAERAARQAAEKHRPSDIRWDGVTRR